MQQVHLSRLSPDLRAFVQDVETQSGLVIQVSLDADLNTGGPFGNGKLKVDIDVNTVTLHAPTNGYFPDGAVRHEVLHVRRIHVEKVPRLSLAEHVNLAPEFEKGLVQVDNALEHLAIVPTELALHPERREHWEAVMHRVWTHDIPNEQSSLGQRVGACLNWTFLRLVLPDSPMVAAAGSWLNDQQLRTEADAFCDAVQLALPDKVAVTATFFNKFSEIPRHQAALEHMDSVNGSHFEPIPDA